ncbi:cytochrome c-type biogenesis protein [Thauera linaloolentis]|uniref:cytochrome c-type biogenesis protein n=1 Tax=Thauera linaloolentis TaxID=76112 RepID=UPI003521758B
MKLSRGLALAALLAATFPAAAQRTAAEPGAAPTVAADPQLEADVMELSHKLRCLVCQNQSIAESNAPLAVDLREQVREQLASGRSKGEVVDYLVARYGDFVLYEPPFKATTLLLWGGPVMLLVGGAGWLAWRLRRRAGELAAMDGLSEAERRRARDLLAGDAKPSSSESPESRS